MAVSGPKKAAAWPGGGRQAGRGLRKLPHEELWGRLGSDKDRGLDRLARTTGRDRAELLPALLALAERDDPRRSLSRAVGAHALDLAALLLLAVLAALGWRAVGVWREVLPALEEEPTRLSDLLAERSPTAWSAEDLTGRTLVPVPVEAGSLALVGPLPARVSLALVAAEGGIAPLRLDDLAVVATGDREAPWVVLALRPEEAERLLAALADTRPVLLRPPRRP